MLFYVVFSPVWEYIRIFCKIISAPLLPIVYRGRDTTGAEVRMYNVHKCTYPPSIFTFSGEGRQVRYPKDKEKKKPFFVGV
jgi:hypothetical protein